MHSLRSGYQRGRRSEPRIGLAVILAFGLLFWGGLGYAVWGGSRNPASLIAALEHVWKTMNS